MHRSSCLRLRSSTEPKVLMFMRAPSFLVIVVATWGDMKEPPRGVEPLRAGSKPAALPLSYGGEIGSAQGAPAAGPTFCVACVFRPPFGVGRRRPDRQAAARLHSPAAALPPERLGRAKIVEIGR